MDEREDGARLARVASALSDASRATMLLCLLDGRAWTPAELADRAGIARSTATGHVNALVEAGLVSDRRAGRHRYLTIARPEVVAAIEALSTFAVPARPGPTLRSVHADRALRHARSCYDHLAGELGTELLRAWVSRALLEVEDANGPDGDARRVRLTAAGEEWFGDLGIELDRLARGRRQLALVCLDWTERRDHLAGALGAAFMARAQELGWIGRRSGSRAIRVTEVGTRELEERLGLRPVERR
ncbi:winged helix-turn-helix transcriptional regulator [Leucobacter sp. CSA2]|uniref:Winged helix-turn-helix transcriptional regulator n=1 Tax=Leucobacter edaphi TaxID=2796472 RepID=A0A934QC38_9MICO|nr:winged helix-turn-helix domain-containing protein [Leucobacter edaphi]MBK0421438.1 winged helix-turn-helix transcriptional regulator [Leucobacter edaphi]